MKKSNFLRDVCWGIVALALVIGWLLWSEKITAGVMAVKYCFEELADGSLYHYVCEK